MESKLQAMEVLRNNYVDTVSVYSISAHVRCPRSQQLHQHSVTVVNK